MELKLKEIESRLKCQRDVVTSTVILPELVVFDIDHFQKKFLHLEDDTDPGHVVEDDQDHVTDAPVQEVVIWEVVVGAMNDLTELDTV
jgi:hypothetical protein